MTDGAEDATADAVREHQRVLLQALTDTEDEQP